MLRRSFLAALLGTALGDGHSTAPTGVPAVRIGVTAVILADQAAFLARWADYLAAVVARPVQFVVREEYQPVLDMLLEHRLEAAWICGYPYVKYQRALRLLAVPVYQGQPTYQAYLIRPRRRSMIRHWGDLRDKVLAMSDPLSNSGWLVAQAQLRAAALSVHHLRRAFFAHGHRHVAEAVAAELADAGSIDGYIWDTMSLRGLEAARDTEVIWRSPRYGFPPVVVPVRSERTLVRSLRDALVGMPDDPVGRELLAALNLDGFTDAHPALFNSIRDLARSVPEAGMGP